MHRSDEPDLYQDRLILALFSGSVIGNAVTSNKVFFVSVIIFSVSIITYIHSVMVGCRLLNLGRKDHLDLEAVSAETLR